MVGVWKGNRCMVKKKMINELCDGLQELFKRYSQFEKIVIVGGGFGGKVAFEELIKNGKEILFLCDNDKAKHADHFFYEERTRRWIPCKSLDALRNIEEDVLCIVTVRMQ